MQSLSGAFSITPYARNIVKAAAQLAKAGAGEEADLNAIGVYSSCTVPLWIPCCMLALGQFCSLSKALLKLSGSTHAEAISRLLVSDELACTFRKVIRLPYSMLISQLKAIVIFKDGPSCSDSSHTDHVSH